MTTPEHKPQRGTILVTDDDPTGLRFLRLILERSGYRVLAAESARQAREIAKDAGMGNLDCVLADYLMPMETGLDLLQWIRAEDPSLSTIIITGEGGASLIQHSMRGGAVDFLEKPVSRAQMEDAVNRAINTTNRLRKLESTQQSVMAVGKLDVLHKPAREHIQDGQLRYITLPRHEVGGDFLNLLPEGKDTLSFLFGDVSGHDVRAAFVSSYFQGMARGLMLKGAEVEEIVPLFNRTLHDEWNSMTLQASDTAVPIATSLSLCVGKVDFARGEVTLEACGFPLPAYTDSSGRLHYIEASNPPLGWFKDFSFKRECLKLRDMQFLYVGTDGLFDEAADQGLNVFSLIYRLLNGKEEDARSHVPRARDDIFLMRLLMDTEKNSQALPQPIIHETYSGDEHDRIDDLQNIWRRSLQFALPYLPEERIYDILLCCREAVLNALVHGCEKSPGKSCTFQMNFCAADGLLTVRVDDPGHGHNFSVEDRVQNIPSFSGEHMGLAIVSKISDQCAIENDGSTVSFSFRFQENDQ